MAAAHPRERCLRHTKKRTTVQVVMSTRHITSPYSAASSNSATANKAWTIPLGDTGRFAVSFPEKWYKT